MNLYDVIAKQAGDPVFPDDTEDVSEPMTDPRSQTQVLKLAPTATPREGGQFVSPHITGDYGSRNFSTEEDMMTTPVLPSPNSDYLEPETIGSVKDAGYTEMLRVLGVEKRSQEGSPAAMQNMEGVGAPPAPQQQAPSPQPGQPMVQPPQESAQLTPQQIQERAAQPPATQNTPAMQAWNAFR